MRSLTWQPGRFLPPGEALRSLSPRLGRQNPSCGKESQSVHRYKSDRKCFTRGFHMINSQTNSRFFRLKVGPSFIHQFFKIQSFFSRSGRFSLALQELVIRCLALDPGKRKKNTSKITANYIISRSKAHFFWNITFVAVRNISRDRCGRTAALCPDQDFLLMLDKYESCALKVECPLVS